MRYDNPDPGKYQLIVHSLDQRRGDRAHQRCNRPATLQSRLVPRWQDDSVRRKSTGRRSYWIMAVDASTGQQHLILSSSDALGTPTWMPDGNGLLALDGDRATNYTRAQIVFVSYPEGK